MRNIRNIWLVATIACMMLIPSMIHAKVGKTKCVVDDPRDSANVNSSIRHAIHWFNQQGEWQACRDSIDFKVTSAIPLRKPLVISGPNTSSTGEFVFGPKNAKDILTLSISTDTFDGENDKTCAIKISTMKSKIRNIRLYGNNATSAGICVDGSVTLENVEVVGFSGDGVKIGSEASMQVNDVALNKVMIDSVGGSGVLVNEGVGRVIILPNTTIKSVKQGITFKNGMAMSASFIFGTNREVDVNAGADADGLAQYTKDPLDNTKTKLLCPEELLNIGLGLSLECGGSSAEDTTSAETAPVGGETPVATTNSLVEENFMFSAIKGSGGTGKGVDFISSNSMVTVQLWKILKGTTGNSFEIKGAVVEWDPNNIPSIKDDEAFCKNSTKIKDLYRLNIYGVQSGNAEFLNYVVQENVDGGSLGIRNNSSSLGVFDFILTTTTARNFQSIIIVPEFLSRPMGSASEIIPLVQTKEFHCPKLAGGGAISGGAGGYADEIVQYSSFRSCMLDQSTKPTFNADQDYDTDGDNIPDWKEMSVTIDDWKTDQNACKATGATVDCKTYDQFADRGKAKCSCEGMVSCWYKKDTDGDGVPDGSINGGELLDANGFIRDSDNDNVPDVSFGETDSDGDGVLDGVEDRNKAFKQSVDAFLYDDTSIISGETPQPIIDPISNAAATCKLNQWSSILPDTPIPGFTPQAIGISYGLYMIDNEGIHPFSTNLLDESGNLPEGKHLMRLQCRNATTFGQTNFNGRYDKGFDRSDLTKADADIVALTCQPFEIFSLMNDPTSKWVDSNGMKMDASGIPSLFVQKKADGTPDWELIQNVCPDQDGDKIPDCLERWDGQCSTTSANQKQFLNPYTNDSDCDGIPDNEDVCPFTNGKLQGDSVAQCADMLKNNENGGTTVDFNDETDKFSGPDKSYSCDAKKVYINYPAPVISCFFDRDGDGLRDCQEDKDMNGVVAIVLDDPNSDIETRKANIYKEETDPLDKDTDKDGLSDYDELTYSGTNPRLENSDFDNLNDKDEVENGMNPLQPDKSTKAVKGCLNTIMDPTGKPMGPATIEDTDPWNPDTDGDGLYDGVEVKIGTNPNNKDSDGDTLLDGKETNATGGNTTGNWPWYDDVTEKLIPSSSGSYDFSQSNPCSSDTDKDGPSDDVDSAPSLNCVGCLVGDGSGPYGVDFDGDGLPDNYETAIGTDPNNKDTDGDGLVDGCTKNLGNGATEETGEMCYHVKNQAWTETSPNVDENESDPGKMGDETCPTGRDTAWLKGIYTDTPSGNFCGVAIGIACGSDSDGDGLPDYYEKMFDTNPSNPDTDGDGIVDGIETGWVVATGSWPGTEMFILHVQKGKTQFVAGAMTNPNDTDTDKDGLVDGFSVTTNFEDKNCNGKVDVDVNLNPLETDPRSADSDGDGNVDKDEFCEDGVCGSGQNIARATTAQRGGCSVAGGTNGETWGMTLMFVGMLAGIRATVVVMRRTKRSRRACSVKR